MGNIKCIYRKNVPKPTKSMSNLASHAINTKCLFPEVGNVISIQKGEKINIAENIYVHKSNKNNRPIPDRIQVNTKQYIL